MKACVVRCPTFSDINGVYYQEDENGEYKQVKGNYSLLRHEMGFWGITDGSFFAFKSEDPTSDPTQVKDWKSFRPGEFGQKVFIEISKSDPPRRTLFSKNPLPECIVWCPRVSNSSGTYKVSAVGRYKQENGLHELTRGPKGNWEIYRGFRRVAYSTRPRENVQDTRGEWRVITSGLSQSRSRVCNFTVITSSPLPMDTAAAEKLLAQCDAASMGKQVAIAVSNSRILELNGVYTNHLEDESTFFRHSDSKVVMYLAHYTEGWKWVFSTFNRKVLAHAPAESFPPPERGWETEVSTMVKSTNRAGNSRYLRDPGMTVRIDETEAAAVFSRRSNAASAAKYEVLCPRNTALSGVYTANKDGTYSMGDLTLESVQGTWQIIDSDKNIKMQAVERAQQPSEVQAWRVLVKGKVRRCQCIAVWVDKVAEHVRAAAEIVTKCEEQRGTYVLESCPYRELCGAYTYDPTNPGCVYMHESRRFGLVLEMVQPGQFAWTIADSKIQCQNSLVCFPPPQSGWSYWRHSSNCYVPSVRMLLTAAPAPDTTASGGTTSWSAASKWLFPTRSGDGAKNTEPPKASGKGNENNEDEEVGGDSDDPTSPTGVSASSAAFDYDPDANPEMFDPVYVGDDSELNNSQDAARESPADLIRRCRDWLRDRVYLRRRLADARAATPRNYALVAFLAREFRATLDGMPIPPEAALTPQQLQLARQEQEKLVAELETQCAVLEQQEDWEGLEEMGGLMNLVRAVKCV